MWGIFVFCEGLLGGEVESEWIKVGDEMINIRICMGLENWV